MAVHHLIPEGTAAPSALPLLKLNTSNPQMAAFHLPPLPPSTEGWHFSHFTHHYIQPVFIAAHQRRKKEEEEAFLTSPHLFLFFIVLVFIFLSPRFSRRAKEESDDACVWVCVCVCVCGYLVKCSQWHIIHVQLCLHLRVSHAFPHSSLLAPSKGILRVGEDD